MQTVLVEVPPDPREAKSRWGHYKYRSKSSHEISTHCRLDGTPKLRFAQRLMAGNMHSTVHAFEELSCNGFVSVSIEHGRSY